MSVIDIRKAHRSGARLVIGLQGISGSGKTFTALQLAWGMADYDASKVGMLDTENRRGSLYADALKDSGGEVHRFLIGDLHPPFSPQRYIDAIKAFEDAGVEVLVIDSASHEWAGTGGCYDIAKNTHKRMDDWLTAKNEHKRFMSAMLQSNMHIIACIREAPKTDFRDPKNPTYLGLMPIQESQFVFELTASLQMHSEGQQQTVMKCPADLRDILGRQQGYITPQDGKALRAWVDGAGSETDQKVEKYRNRLQSITSEGVAYVADAWKKTPADVRKALGDGFRQQIMASAEAYEQQAAPGDDAAANLNEQVMGDQPGMLDNVDRETGEVRA